MPTAVVQVHIERASLGEISSPVEHFNTEHPVDHSDVILQGGAVQTCIYDERESDEEADDVIFEDDGDEMSHVIAARPTSSENEDSLMTLTPPHDVSKQPSVSSHASNFTFVSEDDEGCFQIVYCWTDFFPRTYFDICKMFS